MQVRCLTGSVRVPDSWVTSKQAVNLFSTWCTARSWIFQPIDASNDFGKDGYVDITDDDARLTGELFSVQVKGGESWTAADGYRIPVGKHRDVWMNSPVPVIGVVHDPKDGRLRWANLTAALRADHELASVYVPDGALLDEYEQLRALIESVRATTQPGLPMALGSDSDDEQEAAVWDCFAIARHNVDALIAVRRCFLALGESGRLAGLVALAFCTPHPDVYWTKQNRLPDPIRRVVCTSMRWNVAEVWQLLEMVDPETGFERGSVGQCIYMLLFEDPDCGELACRTAVAAVIDAPMVASWAMAIYLYLAGERAPAEWARLCAERPEFTDMPHAEHFTVTLRDFGYITLD
jgi:Domain of unknown function (DUF4365)